MRRTSRRRMAKNPQLFVDEISPLDYKDAGFPKGSVQRLALIDTDVGDPERPDRYFQEMSHTVRYGKGGRALKRPRIETDPGASPGTVAFLDFHAWGDPPSVYINYMRTRSDQQRRGLQRVLLASFMQSAVDSGVVRVDFGRIMSPAVWKLYTEYRTAYERGDFPISVSGKYDL